MSQHLSEETEEEEKKIKGKQMGDNSFTIANSYKMSGRKSMGYVNECGRK